MAPQRHNIPLDLLPGSLPQRQPVKLSSLFVSDVDYLPINLELKTSRIETQPEKLVKKLVKEIRVDFEIDFNPNPFGRRSTLVRWNEWVRLTENYLMPELPRHLDERIDHGEIIRPRIQEFELSSPAIPGLVESSAHNFDNLSLLFERNQTTRDGEVHAEEDSFFEGLSSEEDRAPPHTFKTIQRSKVRVSNSSDGGIDEVPNVETGTLREKSIGQQSSETIDLTARNEHEKPQGHIESSSLTDEQLIAHVEMLEKNQVFANAEMLVSTPTDEQLIAHVEMVERNNAFASL